MPDREKVIKCLELCRKLTDSCEGCPYENVPPVGNCMLTMHDDALELLKRQTPIIPITDRQRNKICPNCGTILKGQFCHDCGQAVKWDE